LRRFFGSLTVAAAAPGRRDQDLVKLVIKPIERAFYAVTRPLVEFLIQARISPNSITTFGASFVVASGVAFGLGRVQLGGLLYLLSGIVDTLDGAVARANQEVSRFGAFYDSTLDRIGDAATFSGVAVFYLRAADGTVSYRELAVILALIAGFSSQVVSYARAKAESLGIDCRVGIAQRAERIVLLGVPCMIVGAGPAGLVLFWIVAFLALTSVITVIQRFVHVYRVASAATAPTTPKGFSP
jgi:CDP-diacylglycerol--glycerol-3-phosphate 3-phosphatidyltransferase